MDALIEWLRDNSDRIRAIAQKQNITQKELLIAMMNDALEAYENVRGPDTDL